LDCSRGIPPGVIRVFFIGHVDTRKEGLGAEHEVGHRGVLVGFGRKIGR